MNRNILSESSQNDLSNQGMSIEIGVVVPGDDRNFVMTVCNYNLIPVDLDANQVLEILVPDACIVNNPKDCNDPVDSNINLITANFNLKCIAEV